MPLEVGSIFVRIAGLFDNSEFTKADRVVASERASAKDPINFKVGAVDVGVKQDVTEARMEAEVVAAKPINIPIGVDTSGLAADIAAARAASAGAGGGGAGAAPGGIPGHGGYLSLNPDDRRLLSNFMSRGGGGGGGGGAGGAGAPAEGGGGGARGILGAVGHLLHRPGGVGGMGGFSLGTMLGLGPEHALTAGGAFLGTLAPAAAGGALALGGAAGTEAVGGGADLLVMKNTEQQVKALYAAYETLQTAQQRYGKGSTQAAAAQQALNQQMKEFGGGEGTRRELALAKQIDALRKEWDKAANTVRDSSTSILSQYVSLAQTYVPLVIDAARKNLAEVNKSIKPLFAWLEGPQGKGIFKDLENDFSRNIPTSIHAATQAIELILKLIDDAARRGGHLSKTIDHFFTKENARSASSLQSTVDKLLGDMHMWTHLLEAAGRVIVGLLKQGAGEGGTLVKGLTNVLNKFADWERSAAGAKTLHTFFKQRADELMAILRALGPAIGLFLKFYESVQPLVPGLTLVFNALGSILKAINSLASHSSLFNDMFVVPLGAFLLSWKTFGWERSVGMVGKLAGAFGLISKNVGSSNERIGILNRLAHSAAGVVSRIPGVGGSLAKRLEDFASGGGAMGDAGGIGGATGIGRPGTKTNPIVTVSEGGGGGLPGLGKDAVKTAEGDLAKTAEGGLVSTAERGVASGALAEGASGVAATAAGGAGVAEGGLGLMAGGLAEGGLATALAAALPVALPAAAIAAAVGGAVFAGIKLFGDHSRPSPTTGGTQARAGTREFGTGLTQQQLTAQGKTEMNQAAALMRTTEGAVIWGPGGQTSRQQIGPSAEHIAKANALYKAWGGQLERQLQAGWQQYAHQDEATMLDQWMGAFKAQKPKVQAAGAEAAIAYAEGLERQGRLPSGAAQHMLDAIEERFPYLKQLIGTSAKDLTVSVDHMVGGMKNSLHKLISGPNSFADMSRIVSNAGMTTTEKWGVALNQLKTDTGSSLQGTRRAANAALRGMVSDFVRNLPAIPQAMREQGAVGRQALVSNIRSAIQVVKTQMSTGALNIKTGTKELDALNQALGRANKVIQDQANSLTNIQRAAQAITVGKTTQLLNRAGGGALPGKEFGYGDNMTLVDPLGRPRARMAGDENVYTRHQIPYVDAGLRAIGFQGGSQELWSKVNRPHGYAQGGALPGGLTTPSQKVHPPKRHIPVTIQSALRAARGLTGIDREVGQLDTKYQNQEQLFSLYDGSPLPVNDLTVLMKIREKQWDLLFKEWKQLPADLRNLNRMTYGTPVAGSPATGPHAHRAGGIVQSVSQLQKHVNATSAQITGVQNEAANLTSQAAQSSAQAGATASNVASANAAALARTTDQLNAIHSKSLSDTTQIGNLTQQLSSASGDNYARIQQKIASLKNDRASDQTAAQGLSTQLGNQRRANADAAAQLRQQRYDVAYAQAAERNQLKQKTAALQATLRKLNQELSREQKLEADAKQAIGDVRTRLYGDSSGSGSVQDALVGYGYDMLDLNQQGAPIHRKYIKQMQEIFKKAGLQLPAGWATGKANEFNTPAAVAAQQLQAFQAGLYNVLTQFGSNFVATGANPIGNAGQLMAGVANYGAAAGATPARARGGPLETPYGGMSLSESAGDTHINITQHFAGPPPDAHSYSNGLKWEIGNAI